jgi:hypothetical protein
MFQGERVILKSRMEIGLGEMAGIAGLREEGKIRQLQVPDQAGHTFDGRAVGLPLKPGVGEHQAQEQQTGAQQGQAKARFSDGKPGLCLFLPEKSSNQGF